MVSDLSNGYCYPPFQQLGPDEEKVRGETFIGGIAESVWNDADVKAKPNDEDLQHKHFNDVETLIEQVLKENIKKKFK